MKKFKRTGVFVLAIILIMQVFTIGGLADSMEYFQVDWDYEDATITATIESIWDSTADEFYRDVADLEPYMEVTKDGEIVAELPFALPAKGAKTASCSYVVTAYGEYEFRIMNNFGVQDGVFIDQDTGYWYPYSFSLSYTGGDTDYTDPDTWYDWGYYFVAEAETGDDVLKFTLSGINERVQNNLREYIVETQPCVVAELYDENGEYAGRDVVPFSGSTLRLNMEGYSYAFCTVSLKSFADDGEFIPAAVQYDEATGTYYEFIYEYGEGIIEDTIVFDDVPEGSWYEEFVYIAVDLGLIKGKTDTSYKPHDNMTYAEAFALAARMHSLYYTGDADSYFEANMGKPWYQVYVEYCEEYGITCKCNDYNASITREDFAHIFYAALPRDMYYEINFVDDGAIPDVSMNHKYADEIYTFYRAGILIGSDANGTFHPEDNIKRNEVATILCRMFDIGRDEITLIK